ncbi:MAG: DUF815 domain-containing protein [Deferribacterota bacterium]|nr:DUF815 domain-containing protein [Deferribacterota bacterium]
MDLDKNIAFRWNGSEIEVIDTIEKIEESDLLFLDRQKQLSKRNIENFIEDKPFLNMFFWGPRGVGKSSLVKLLLNLYKQRNLRVIECSQEYIEGIYKIYRFVRTNNKYYFIVYFDDISFDNSDISFRRFKSIMEGGLEEKPINLLYIATSNKRHIVKETMKPKDDVYSNDLENEQLSLFARFGLSITFPLLTRREYITVVRYYLDKYLVNLDNLEEKAENFATNRGGRSARVAKQFAIYSHLVNDDL